MKKIALLFLLIMMSAPSITYQSDTTEKAPSELANQQVEAYFDQLPQNPLTLTSIQLYKDSDLTQETKTVAEGQTLSLAKLVTNSQGQTVFQLTDGSYTLASQKTIVDDVVKDKTAVDAYYWLPASYTLYDSPQTAKSKTVSQAVSPYSRVHITAQATTQAGSFSQIDNQAWIKTSALSSSDNRIEKVQSLLNQKYNKANYSIYVKQLDSQEEAGINADTTMYSASISKLPILYYTQKQLNDKQIELTTSYKYTDAVNAFTGAYDPSGSGDLPKTADNKSYSLSSLISAVAGNSDNVASNMLGYYVTDSFGEDFQTSLKNLGISWDMESRVVSSKTAGLMMEALYDQDGQVLEALTHTNFDSSRIAKNIPVTVAHKIGDAYDYKHDVAVVYADSPFILSIFTNDASYDDITAIADDVYAILK